MNTINATSNGNLISTKNQVSTTYKPVRQPGGKRKAPHRRINYLNIPALQDDLIICESILERDCALILALNPEVVRIECQPETISLGECGEYISGALEDKRHLKDEYGLSHEWLTTPIIWEKLVLDNALSHHSEILHSMAKNLGFSIEFSAVRSPWEKGSVENLMLQFTRALPHHGRPTKPTEVKSRQSKKLEKARVYFDDLVQYLHQFVVDIYPHKLNKRTNTSPYIEMEKALREHGSLCIPTMEN